MNQTIVTCQCGPLLQSSNRSLHKGGLGDKACAKIKLKYCLDLRFCSQPRKMHAPHVILRLFV